MKLNRRSFLAASAATVIAAQSRTQAATSRCERPNWRLHDWLSTARAAAHIKDILEMKDEAEYVALCDVDSEVLEQGAKIVESAQGKRPKLYRDIREALADKGIDAVTIATPNHWHALAAIWACQAGKDVYVEKPLCHNIYEGQQLVAAAKKHGTIVQHGTQNRSNATLIRDMKLIHDGFIGKIVESRGYVYKNGNRGAIGHGKPGPVPTESGLEIVAGTIAQITNSWSTRIARNPAFTSITIGIGFGNMATAKLAIRAFTRWIWPFGDTTVACRLRFIAAAGGLAWTMTRKRRIRKRRLSPMATVRF